MRLLMPVNRLAKFRIGQFVRLKGTDAEPRRVAIIMYSDEHVVPQYILDDMAPWFVETELEDADT